MCLRFIKALLALEENHTFWKLSLHWFAFGWTVFIELQLSPNENHAFWKLNLPCFLLALGHCRWSPPRRTKKMQNWFNDYWRGPYEIFGGWFWRILRSSCGIPGLGWLACENVILVWGSSSKVELTSQSCRFSYQDPHQNPRWHRIIPDRGHHDQHRDNKLFMSQEACVTCLDARKPLLNIIRFHKT